MIYFDMFSEVGYQSQVSPNQSGIFIQSHLGGSIYVRIFVRMNQSCILENDVNLVATSEATILNAGSKLVSVSQIVLNREVQSTNIGMKLRG